MNATKALFGILTLTIALVAEAQAQAPFTGSLVAYYPFNGNADDATGNGNNGALFGAAAFGVDRFGNSNACLSLPGSEGGGSGVDVLSLSNAPVGNLTYSAWFLLSKYPPGGGDAFMPLMGRIVCGNTQCGAICINAENGVSTNQFTYFTGGASYYGHPAAPLNIWCQVVFTVDASGDASFYLNGTNLPGSGLAPPSQPIGFCIGAAAGNGCGSGGDFFVWNGLIDDVRVYNRALSSNEVQELYQYELTPPSQVPFTSNLVAYYPFDGNAKDATGHGNDGQIIGSVVPATDRFGNASRAYHFNGSGSDSAIEVTNTLFNIGQAGYTISGWFASDNVTDVLQIIWNSIPETGIGLAFNDGTLPPYAEYAVGTAKGAWTTLDVKGTRTTYANQTWYQSVLTKNGTSYTTYINGIIDSQLTNSAASGYDADVGFIIGSITPINPPFPDTFLGRLDDFRVYNRALSSNEVLQLYQYESTPPPAQAPFTNSLVAYFPFDGNAKDESGNGNDGVLFGAAAFGVDRFGNSNASLSLPGTQGNGSGVDVSSLTSLPYGPVTYSAWFWLSNYPPPPAGGIIVMNLMGREECEDGSDGTLCVFSDPAGDLSNNLIFFTGGDGSSTHLVPPTNRWCSVVVTMDQSGAASFYFDGTNVASTGQSPLGQPVDFRIGASAGNSCDYQYVWNGLIDDVRIYNRALTSDEVQELYAYEVALATVTLIAEPAYGGTVTVGGAFPAGSQVQISATPNSGWVFTGWNDGNTQNPRTITVPSNNVTYVASFVTNKAGIILIAAPSAGGTVNGGGTFEIESQVEISAAANDGWTFTGWNDGNTQNPRTITVPPGGAAYAASFTFVPASGSYSGLFYDPNDIAFQSSGFFSLTLTAKGGFSARLHLAGGVNAFSGRFSTVGAASNYLSLSKTKHLTIQAGFTSGGLDILSGQISDGTWTAELVANRAVYSKTNPASQAGKYTVLIPGSSDPSAQPGGDGFGAVTVNHIGNLTFSGTLGDGSAVSQTAVVSGQGQWPFYVSLYSGKGSILGWLTFSNQPASDIAGATTWTKLPQPTAIFYPAGFACQTNAVGSSYQFTNGTPVLNFAAGQLWLANGNLAQSFTNQFALGKNSKVTDTNKMTLAIAPLTGLFTGSVVNPATKKTIPIHGAVLQKQNTGAGYFRSTNETGGVFLGPGL